jgi:SnoaL-like domain
MERAAALDLLSRLHAAQNEHYSGGSDAALRRLLAPAITWTVPGDNSIAGTYTGLEEVLGYFRRRRDLAGRTFQMRQRDVLVGAGERIAALVDGCATIGDVTHRWSTVGLYDVSGGRIAACWLLPLDQRAFDAIWSIPGAAQPSRSAITPPTPPT